MSTEQNYAPRESYAIAIPPSAKKPPRITLRPFKRQVPTPVDLAPELWRPVVGFEKCYEVSSLGQIRSLLRLTSENLTKGKLLRPAITAKGYERACLCANSKQYQTLVHRAVAIAFIPNPLRKPEVNHIDGNPLNNKLSNLEWVTHAENMQHAIRIGLVTLQAYVPPEMGTQIIAEYCDSPPTKQLTRRQLREKYGLGVNALETLLRKYRLANQIETHLHSEEKRIQVVNEYQNRKVTGITIDTIAKKHNLSVYAIRGILRRSKKALRKTEFLTSQTFLNYE